MGKKNSAADVNWRKGVDLVKFPGVFSGSGGFDQLRADT